MAFCWAWCHLLGLGGGWMGGLPLRLFLGTHVHPAPLKKHQNWVVLKLKNHTLFWVTGAENDPFWHHFIQDFVIKIPFFTFLPISITILFNLLWKTYPLSHFCRFRSPYLGIWVTQPAQKRTLSLRFPDAHAYPLKYRVPPLPPHPDHALSPTSPP